jgi:uncharacterized protein (TIGR00369 family)
MAPRRAEEEPAVASARTPSEPPSGQLPANPFLGWLGLVFERYEPDDVRLRLPFRTELSNDGTHYHGGVVASVLDTAGAAAAWAGHDAPPGARTTTVSMTVQYVGGAKGSDLVCEARTVRRRRELVFTEVTATGDEGAVIAHAVQTYRIA